MTRHKIDRPTHAEPGRRPLRLALKPLGYWLVTIVLLITSCLTLLEGIVRVFFPAYDPSGHVYMVSGPNGLKLGPANQTLRHIKNTGDYDVEVHFNAYGFRDAKDLSATRSGDIIVVGDSFAFGWGVAESLRFSNVLETLIHRRVFNVAIPGADIEDYDHLLEYAASLGGSVNNIVMEVCMENDLHFYNDPVYGGGKEVAASRLRLVETPLSAFTLEHTKAWLTRNSAAYLLVTTAIQQNVMLKKFAVYANLLVPNLDGIGRNEYSESIIERSARRLAQIASRYENVLVLVAPSRGLWVGNNRAGEDRVHREFINALKAHNLTVVDMRAIFEFGGNPLSNHFRDDGHWNIKGHRSAARMLAAALSK